MDGSNNQLGATGGAVATDNPQNAGSQNLTPAQNNLQQQGAAALNSQNLRLTDANGQPFNIATTGTVQSAAIKPPVKTHSNLPIIGLSALIIVVVFAATWLISRQSGQTSY